MRQQAVLCGGVRIGDQPGHDYLAAADQHKRSRDVDHRLRILEMGKAIRPHAAGQHGNDADTACHLEAALRQHPAHIAGYFPFGHTGLAHALEDAEGAACRAVEEAVIEKAGTMAR
nr:hypothetical protein [Cupriavidus taiwanensis]